MADVNLNFKAGEITGLIGYNGSGKTTIFNLILNFIDKDKGIIKIDGQEVDHNNLIEFCYVARSDEFNQDETILNNIKNIGYLYGLKTNEIVKKAYELAEFFELKANMKKDTFKKVSKGNAQKIALIQLFMNPFLKYLFLDEPFDGLDPIITSKIVKYLQTRKKEFATIVTSHRLDVIEEMVDNFYVIKDGEIVFNSRENELVKTFKVLINSEINIDKIKGNFIKKITKNTNGIVIELESKKDFAKLTKLLVKDENYELHQIMEEKLTNRVFEEYKDAK